MKYIIRFFSSFGDSKQIKEILERLCETKYISDYDSKIKVTHENDFTHVIILNTAMPTLPSNFPKENVIGLAFEPIIFLGLTESFIEYAKKNIGKYFIGDVTNLPKPFIEHFSYMWHCTPSQTIPIKSKQMSIMISEKGQTFGHKYRHRLVAEILKQGFPIDIYGRGCKYYSNLNDSRLKGEFDELEPYKDYEFHICIENMESNHYFSEKVMNPLLNGTTPIYLGCKNIKSYFGNIITLSSQLNVDIDLIKTILLNPITYKKSINLENIKNTISLYRNLDTIFT